MSLAHLPMDFWTVTTSNDQARTTKAYEGLATSAFNFDAGRPEKLWVDKSTLAHAVPSLSRSGTSTIPEKLGVLLRSSPVPHLARVALNEVAEGPSPEMLLKLSFGTTMSNVRVAVS